MKKTLFFVRFFSLKPLKNVKKNVRILYTEK